MTTPGSLIERFGFAFLPADPARRGVVVEAGPDWLLDPPDDPTPPDVVVWGRTPDTGSSPVRAARSAIARERALRSIVRRPPDGFEVVAIHRLPAARLGPGLRASIRAGVRAGALVELSADASIERVVDACLGAGGARGTGQTLWFGSGGTLLARVGTSTGPGLLRLAPTGSPGDPATLGRTLSWLAAAGVAMAPRPLGSGMTAGGSWTLETLLPGRRPSRLDVDLAHGIALALAAFPRADSPPTALADDLAEIAGCLPDLAARTDRLAAEVAGDVAVLTGILRHGDLWTGNVLARDRRLTGFVDWDAAHRAGIPGSDLVQVVAVDQRARRHQTLGQAFLARPWDSTEFRSAAAAYWPTAGIEPSTRAIELAGLGWWAAEVRGTLSRVPERATDARWLAANVEPVLDSLGV